MRKIIGVLCFSAGLVAAGGCDGGGGATPSATKALTSFSFLSPAAAGVIDEEAKTVLVTVPSGSAVTALVANFGSTGTGVTIGAVAQVSGVTPNDFTSQVTYTVSAADRSTATYRVSVTACGAHTTSTLGACPCATGFGDCDDLAATGCEQQLSTDPGHCGACGTACSSGVCVGGACRAATCGDGVVQAPEGCDPGSGAFTLTCNSNCTVAACGDGIVNPVAGEGCDAGGATDTAGCLMAAAAGARRCQVSACGDGYVNAVAGEGCDTAGVDTATCNGRTCTVVSCGDGYANAAAAEQCDTGGTDTATCNGLSCTVASCGDGYANAAAGEPCDTGGIDTATCNARTCQTPSCGDGYANGAAGEPCDTGGIDTPTCNGRTCRWPICGDAYLNLTTNETCDDGGSVDTAACNMGNSATYRRCQVSSCGDGYANAAAGERCDPGGIDTPTCNGLICTLVVCGDGYVNLMAVEQCDLGAANGTPGACCSPSCRLEAGFTSCP